MANCDFYSANGGFRLDNILTKLIQFVCLEMIFFIVDVRNLMVVVIPDLVIVNKAIL